MGELIANGEAIRSPFSGIRANVSSIRNPKSEIQNCGTPTLARRTYRLHLGRAACRDRHYWGLGGLAVARNSSVARSRAASYVHGQYEAGRARRAQLRNALGIASTGL